jgi:hypothetical protein
MHRGLKDIHIEIAYVNTGIERGTRYIERTPAITIT